MVYEVLGGNQDSRPQLTVELSGCPCGPKFTPQLQNIDIQPWGGWGSILRPIQNRGKHPGQHRPHRFLYRPRLPPLPRPRLGANHHWPHVEGKNKSHSYREPTLVELIGQEDHSCSRWHCSHFLRGEQVAATGAGHEQMLGGNRRDRKRQGLQLAFIKQKRGLPNLHLAPEWGIHLRGESRQQVAGHS